MNPYSYGNAIVPGVTFNNHHDFYRYLQQANASPYTHAHAHTHTHAPFHTPFENFSRVNTITSRRRSSSEPYASTVYQQTDLCPCCDKSTAVHPSLKPHDEQFPEKCYEHEICMPRGGWKEHLQSTVHTQCPLVGCPKSGADFGSDRRFLQHWRNKHPNKLWAWERYTTCWGSQRVRWRKWNGR